MSDIYKVGDKVKHGYRKHYQSCVVTKVEEGCNGLIKVVCKDGFYGREEESNFPAQDLIKTN
tara:strand:+ start:535 stop:720 length:186 start_codon:yes stop_codon:yes gene_type:complete